MNFSENLRAFRSQNGMTQKYLGQQIGVTPVTIGNWERGVKQPSIDYLCKLADLFGISADILIGRQTRTSTTVSEKFETEFLRKYWQLDTYGRQAVDMLCNIELERIRSMRKKVIPFDSIKNKQPDKETPKKQNRYIPFFTAPSAAGITAPLEGDDFEMLLADDSVPEEADYAIRISGDSMEPYINDGDMVFVKEDHNLDEGDVGIFCVNGEMYCKQYFVDDEKNLHLISANSARKNTNIYVQADSGFSVRFCGKVLLGFTPPLPDYWDGE